MNGGRRPSYSILVTNDFTPQAPIDGALTKKPVLITHSNARALAPGHPLVLLDAMMPDVDGLELAEGFQESLVYLRTAVSVDPKGWGPYAAFFLVILAASLGALAETSAALAELDARRLYLAQGCSSLFAYCTSVLHYSEHGAFNRIEVARAAARKR